jgi:hypothetical protein
MDARGVCPHCGEVLAEWTRRTNRLVVHTWAGFADVNARPEGGRVARLVTREEVDMGRRSSVRTPRTVMAKQSKGGMTGGDRGRPSSQTELSNGAGLSNPTGSGTDRGSGGMQKLPGRAARTRPGLFRDPRTGEWINLDSVGRAISR